mmetsp:Transcript_24701/g.60753  ORF Transcript_24701/g.60753 Transcript_24701/m.60753 type:complete len:189 (+) Transcript_24701:674-1240(+)
MFYVTRLHLGNISDRLQANLAEASTQLSVLDAVAYTQELVDELSPRSLEHCDVDTLIDEVRKLALPSAGDELEAGVANVRTSSLERQRRLGALNITRSLAVRKDSNGSQHTPTTPDVINNYLDQVSKDALSPEGKKAVEAVVRDKRRREVDEARDLTASHAGRPFADISVNEPWVHAGTIGTLHGVLA